ncbi:MAG: GNAT family N-acetyltransferase [Pseudomonadota bacterium]
MSKIKVAQATKADVTSMVSLSYQKRRAYEKAQPQFWRYAEGAEEVQQKWFEELLGHDDYIILVAKSDIETIGFIIGRLVKAPEVYDPGGLTLMIDDFCVKSESDWQSVGLELMNTTRRIAKEKGAAQFYVVSGAHDNAKCDFLEKFGLSNAAKWYVGSI